MSDTFLSEKLSLEENAVCYQFLMRGASFKRVGPCVRLSVTHLLQICKMQKNTREKVHIVSAREISTYLCVEMTMSLKILDIVSARKIRT